MMGASWAPGEYIHNTTNCKLMHTYTCTVGAQKQVEVPNRNSTAAVPNSSELTLVRIVYGKQTTSVRVRFRGQKPRSQMMEKWHGRCYTKAEDSFSLLPSPKIYLKSRVNKEGGT